MSAGCGGRGRVARRAARARTVKPCGPVPSTLGSSLRVMIPRATVANKPDTPGRARSSRSNHCAGSAGCFRRTCSDYARLLFHFANEAAGAACARHSLRPLFSEGHRRCTTRAQNAPREECFTSSSLRAKRSNPFFVPEGAMDCFVAQPVIGPAQAGRTRWLLAMTVIGCLTS